MTHSCPLQTKTIFSKVASVVDKSIMLLFMWENKAFHSTITFLHVSTIPLWTSICLLNTSISKSWVKSKNPKVWWSKLVNHLLPLHLLPPHLCCHTYNFLWVKAWCNGPKVAHAESIVFSIPLLALSQFQHFHIHFWKFITFSWML
jgi:hypothetical protein